MYATAQDLESRLGGVDELAALADRNGDGLADAALVARALADADAEIDSYLAGRYALPLAVVPPVLSRLACDVAVYRLASEAGSGLTEERRTRYEDAVAWLRRAADGQVSLGLPETPPQASPLAPGLVSGGRRRFGRRSS